MKWNQVSMLRTGESRINLKAQLECSPLQARGRRMEWVLRDNPQLLSQYWMHIPLNYPSRGEVCKPLLPQQLKGNLQHRLKLGLSPGILRQVRLQLSCYENGRHMHVHRVRYCRKPLKTHTVYKLEFKGLTLQQHQQNMGWSSAMKLSRGCAKRS